MHRKKKARLAQTLVELGVGEDEKVVGALGDKGHVRDIVLGCRNDTSELCRDERAGQRPVHVVGDRALQQCSQVRNGGNLLRHQSGEAAGRSREKKEKKGARTVSPSIQYLRNERKKKTRRKRKKGDSPTKHIKRTSVCQMYDC